MLTEQDRHEIRMELERRLGLSGFERKQQMHFNATAGLARAFESGVIQEWEKREPVTRQRSLSADFALPLFKSLTTGTFAGVIAGAFAGDPVVGAWGLTLVGGATWLLQMFNDSRLNWRVERIVGRDLEGDGWISEPVREKMPHPPSADRQKGADRPIIVNSKNGMTGQPVAETWPTLDASNPNRRLARDLAEFLAIGANDGFAIRQWKGQRLSSGTEVTDPIWREWTGMLKAANILTADNSGTRLAVPLDDALRSIFAGA